MRTSSASRRDYSAARKKPGGSNAGKYPGVKDFAAQSGAAPKGS